MNANHVSTPTSAAFPAGAQHDTQPVSMAHLRELPFFEDFSGAHLAELVPHTKVSYFEAGQPMLTQGELANRFYVLVSGRAVIECKINGDVLPVQEIGPGEAVGFSWFFTPEKLHFTARATEPVKAIFFYGTLLREDCELDPSLGYQLMLRTGRILVERMAALVGLLTKRR